MLCPVSHSICDLTISQASQHDQTRYQDSDTSVLAGEQLEECSVLTFRLAVLKAHGGRFQLTIGPFVVAKQSSFQACLQQAELISTF